MAEIPNPCFDPEAFFIDTGDSLTYLKRKPGGGLGKDVDGVFVETVPMHYARNSMEIAAGGPISGGIIAPAGTGPVGGLYAGTPITNVTNDLASLRLTGSCDLVLLAPAAASRCEMHVDVTFDGVTYQRIHTIGYYTDSGPRAGYFSRQQDAYYGGSPAFNPGAIVTPQFVILYEQGVGGDGADLISAGNIHVDYEIHTL